MVMRREPHKKLNYPFDIMNWVPKNMHDSIFPIMILNWIAGLSIWECPLGKPRPVITYIYVFLMNSFYWLLIVSHPRGMEVDNLNKTSRNVFEIIVYFNVTISVSSILIGWYHYKAFKTNIERLAQLDVALERLGLPNNYRKIFIDSILKVAVWFLTVGVILVTDLYLLSPKNNWLKCLHVLYIFHCPLHVNSVVDFTFTSIINIIGIRFMNINLLLKRHLEKCPQPKIVTELYPKYSRVSALVMSTEYSFRLKEKQLEKQTLILCRFLHMELSNISWEVNKIYQKQMMMEVGAYFVILTGLLYSLFSMMFFFKRTFNFKSMRFINECVWFAVYAYKLINITSTCAKVSLEAHKARDLLYERKILSEDEELREEIEQFSLQLTQNPLVFTLCGLSTLDYGLVQKFIGTVTTYLVLLINLSPEIKE